MKRAPLLAAALVLASGCGSSGPKAQAPSGTPCHSSGAMLSIVAKDLRFSTGCLAAPVNEPFTIDFDNRDSAVHSVSITSTDPKRELFRGDLVSGPAMVTYRVPALPGGLYQFRCAIHPQTMFGVFVVEG